METLKYPEFNLVREPWIMVMKEDGVIEEVGLLDLFERAHQFRALAGELPTQDIAVLRLLLAILHSIFGRYDPDGEFAPLYDGNMPGSPEEVYERWHTLWEQGQFTNSIIGEYLKKYEDRFWLFHHERPFYQVPVLDEATEYLAAKLNGEIAESGNKIRLFTTRAGISKKKLSFGESARWLLHVNGYDDTSSKPKGDNLSSPGVGWLGKLGLVYAVGHNLFETLLLNLVMLKDEEQKPWSTGEAVWEKDIVRTEERSEIVLPDNPAELLTLQSRRLLLRREGFNVVGYSLIGGDFFPPNNAFAEQMTVWRLNDEKKGLKYYKPRRHDPSRLLWRDLSSLLVNSVEQHRCPGVVSWIRHLNYRKLIKFPLMHFQISAVKYGDKDFFVNDVFSDGIAFHVELLNKYGEDWITRIIDNIDVAELLAKEVGILARKLAKAAGDKDIDRINQMAVTSREQAYYRLDHPFRLWLEQINPSNDDMREVSVRWWEQSRDIIRKIGKEMVEQCGRQAFIERIIEENKQKKRYSVPLAYNDFLYRTTNIDTMRGGKNK